MIIKKSYLIPMSYEISESEKKSAKLAFVAFNEFLNHLKICIDHLELIYVPFKDNKEINSDNIIEHRASFRQYRDKDIENFDILVNKAFECIKHMQVFSSDTQTLKLINSFKLSMGDVVKQVNNFVDLFGNLSSDDFRENIIKCIDTIKKDSKELEQIIEDRIKNHIEKDILAANWVDDIGSKINVDLSSKPALINLYKERQEALSNKITEENKK